MKQTMIWWAIWLGSAAVLLTKILGHLVGRRLAQRSADHPNRRRFSGESLVGLVTVALLSALTAVQTIGNGKSLVIDARLVGLVVAGLALWRRAPFIVVVVLAAATTAGLRALGWLD
ncbi:MAG: AzlD domain-containing protein [Bifidobacteriaceae bacterium]|jgi:hypothetical protein|nr:AzlD domain-containing protein [Bifidobacteriaceae bacterium]